MTLTEPEWYVLAKFESDEKEFDFSFKVGGNKFELVVSRDLFSEVEGIGYVSIEGNVYDFLNNGRYTTNRRGLTGDSYVDKGLAADLRVTIQSELEKLRTEDTPNVRDKTLALKIFEDVSEKLANTLDGSIPPREKNIPDRFKRFVKGAIKDGVGSVLDRILSHGR